MRFAGALVAKQQFLRRLSRCRGPCEPGGSRSLQASTGKAFKFAKAMPAVGRALSQRDDASPKTSSISVITDFVSGYGGLFCPGGSGTRKEIVHPRKHSRPVAECVAIRREFFKN